MSQTDTLTRTVLLVLLALVAIPIVMMVVMMSLMGGFGWAHMGGWMWHGSGGWIGMLLVMLIPLIVILGVGYLIYQSLTTAGTETEDDAITELRNAYARGDISDEEFETRRERLEQDTKPS